MAKLWLAVLLALPPLEGLFAAMVLPGAPIGWLLAGVAAQWAASAVLLLDRGRPHLGLLAVVVVSAVLLLADSPWRQLAESNALTWSTVALAWATVRVLDESRTPGQLRLSAFLAIAYAVCAVIGSTSQAGAWNAAVNALVGFVGGFAISSSRRLNRARRDRVAAAAREALAEQRRRIARQMHDTVSHKVTLLVLNANALAVTSGDPEARQAAERMSSLGTGALGELRDFLHLLADPELDAPDSGSVPAVESLVDQARRAGATVVSSVRGDPGDCSAETAEVLRLTVQEGLANAAKHAPGGLVTVGLDYRAATVTVRNAPSRRPPGRLGRAGGGQGLAGLGHRLGELGGGLRAGPAADGGFEVVATVPVRAAT